MYKMYRFLPIPTVNFKMWLLLALVVFAFPLFADNSATAIPAPLSDFRSDGCSLFPDGDLIDSKLWCKCCFEHDIAYWKGGTEQERNQADQILKSCVFDKTKNKSLAEVMFQGVQVGGLPIFPTWYRWGYGWQYGRGFQALSNEEKILINKKLSHYRLSKIKSICD